MDDDAVQFQRAVPETVSRLPVMVWLKLVTSALSVSSRPSRPNMPAMLESPRALKVPRICGVPRSYWMVPL